MRIPKRRPSWGIATISTILLVVVGSAAAEEDIDLTAFDLEDLMSMEVTSVSKKAERAFEAPAAAFVITSDDIRRSGKRTLPELLRMVPGVQVARLTSSEYAISVRGFNGTFVDKLLVLIDGRSVYTPLFAGVFWGVQDTPLADIARIEVIRGPGGTVWGANAVNGVINIVTKSAADTHGWHVEVGAGDYERAGSGVARYGGSIGDNVDFRVYLKQFDRDDLKRKGDLEAADEWEQIRTGFRMDAQLSEAGVFTLQGDLYDGKGEAIVSGAKDETNVGGGNVLARYAHTFSDTHNASVQFYYDRTDRQANILTYELDTFDVELKHQIAPLPWLGFVWGGEYRHRHDDATTRNPEGFDTAAALGTPFDGFLALLGLEDTLRFSDSSRKTDLYSGFVQAEGRAFDDLIRLTVGTKLEQNDTSGFEVQPSARLAIVPNKSLTVWASASRAVRTPSRSNEDLETLGVSSADVFVRNSGNRDIESEDLMAYEAGIRIQPIDWLHFDLAGYYNVYDDMIVQDITEIRIVPVDFGPGGIIPIPVVERTASNHADATAWGIEFFARAEVLEDQSVLEKWWIDATYAYIDVDVDRDGGMHFGNTGLVTPGDVGDEDSAIALRGRSEAHHTVGLRSHMNFAWNLELDLAYYYTSRVEDVFGDDVDAYHKVDLRTAWNANENVQLEFTVENLFDEEHSEWNSEQFIQGTNVPRMFYGRVTLDF